MPLKSALLKDAFFFRDCHQIYKRLYNHFGPQHWWPGDDPLEIAIGAILTQNTAWTNVERAIRNLKDKRVLNVPALLRMSDRRMAELIRPAGYFNVKTKRLKSFLRYLRKRGVTDQKLSKLRKIPSDDLRSELLEVRGIGPETADSILLYALDRPFFVVDAYTKRIFSRHGHFSETATYDEVQRFFAEKLVTVLRRAQDSHRLVRLFNEYHALIVALGKTYCRTKPRCQGCPIEKRIS